MTRQEIIESMEEAIKQPGTLVRIFKGTLIQAVRLLKEQKPQPRCIRTKRQILAEFHDIKRFNKLSEMLDELIEDAYNSGFADGQKTGSGGGEYIPIAIKGK